MGPSDLGLQDHCQQQEWGKERSQKKNKWVCDKVVTEERGTSVRVVGSLGFSLTWQPLVGPGLTGWGQKVEKSDSGGTDENTSGKR